MRIDALLTTKGVRCLYKPTEETDAQHVMSFLPVDIVFVLPLIKLKEKSLSFPCDARMIYFVELERRSKEEHDVNNISLAHMNGAHKSTLYLLCIIMKLLFVLLSGKRAGNGSLRWVVVLVQHDAVSLSFAFSLPLSFFVCSYSSMNIQSM